MNRPTLTASLHADEFAAWYWLKEELVTFCRLHGISSVGLKREIEARIHDFLSGDPSARKQPRRRPLGMMPKEFTLESVIGEGWRCGPALGAFFKGLLGNGFHFNAEMRDFIHTEVGKTLQDAAICYQHSVRKGRTKSPIPEQLEYNRHFREYFQKNPGATRQDAIAAWWVKRSGRREE
jgi:hypothetical protein